MDYSCDGLESVHAVNAKKNFLTKKRFWGVLINIGRLIGVKGEYAVAPS